MAKFYGAIGFADLVETKPGVWTEQITERYYYGDVVRNARRLQSTEHLNDDVVLTNSISIVADPYANDHFHSIRYAKYQGAAWKISNVDVQRPRLVLTLGGVWNGKQA